MTHSAPKHTPKHTPKHFIDQVDHLGQGYFASAATIGALLKETFSRDPHFYLFSPDETTSNKLTAVYETEKRTWNLPQATWDLPESPSGRIVELLSENVLLATMIGHLLNCESAMFASYESFLMVVASQIIQHCKFLAQAQSVTFRPNYPALNLLSTSTCWRQDHNGFSHQSPALISTLLARPDSLTNCLFPVDDVAATAAYHFMLQSENVVNLTTFNKTLSPRWIDSHHAQFQLENGGASIFDFASAANPTYIFTAAGDIPTREALAAIQLLKTDLPAVKIRFVGLAALCYNAIGTTQNPLPQATFDEYFTTTLPIIANFHGYPATLRTILSQYAAPSRLTVHGFEDHGTTTTPFEMLTLNHASRYDLALDVAQKENQPALVEKYQNIIAENRRHAHHHGLDLIPE